MDDLGDEECRSVHAQLIADTQRAINQKRVDEMEHAKANFHAIKRGQFRRGISGNPQGRPKKVQGVVSVKYSSPISEVEYLRDVRKASAFYVSAVVTAQMPIEEGDKIITFLLKCARLGNLARDVLPEKVSKEFLEFQVSQFLAEQDGENCIDEGGQDDPPSS